jgi:hypothetical protein
MALVPTRKRKTTVQVLTIRAPMPPQVCVDHMTPSAVEVLLHYHMTGEPHPRHNAPAVVDARQRFLVLGVIEPRDVRGILPVMAYTTTERGKRWVEVICRAICPN